MIAVVGKKGESAIADRMAEYFPALRKTQVGSNPELRLLIPKYTVVYFDNETELFDYIADPGYNDNSTVPGVCLGFGVNETEDGSYEAKFYFNDQSFLGSVYAYAIPP